MSSYSRALMLADLVRDEGFRAKPYQDTVGKLTIGIGRNLDDVGVTRAEAELLCGHDLDGCEAELDEHTPWWRQMTEPRQRALLNMCFNLGWPRLSKFVTTLGHLQAGRYHEAADAALDSQWAHQVGSRAKRIAAVFRGEALVA